MAEEVKATLATSRRNFLAGSRLALGAGLAVGLGLVKSGPAKATPDPDCDPRCLLLGTMIETPEGSRKVEDLKIGDMVLTASGSAKPVKWIGSREAKWTADTAPVKIARFAIDGKAPLADLYVSRGHAIFIDGMLIPAGDLVNGVTIVANARPDLKTVTYFHVELDSHEVILAEGLGVESFNGEAREAFDNADEYVKLYGPFAARYASVVPFVSHRGGRGHFASHMRSALAPIYDIRRPIDKARDRIMSRAA